MHDWSTTNDGLKKEFHFESMTKMSEFFLLVARLSDARNHHPNIEIKGIKTMILNLITHDENKITEKDVELSIAIDGLNY